MKKHLPLVLILMLFVLPASADQVIFDDSIVQGSQCVGVDCVNGEAFGFSTIVLKENNLRIYFQDTSNSGSFPSTDWQLTANDSNNGGRNRFSIEDVSAQTEPFTVMGGAPSGALTVDATGRVGAGTATPSANLHVQAADTPTLRLAQSADAGWPAYTWEAASNEAGLEIRDQTARTTPFRVASGAVNDALVVEADGNVTIAGTLEQGSSRAIKDVFALDPNDVLARVEGLEISEWRYKGDATAALHVGPMAEDFHRTFGLGSGDTHIAVSDVAGVALASVQAMAATIDTQKATIDELQAQNRNLEERLARLEALVGR